VAQRSTAEHEGRSSHTSFAPGHLTKFIDLYKPLVSGQWGMQGNAILCVCMVCLTHMLWWFD
jgi:hypothetical protein